MTVGLYFIIHVACIVPSYVFYKYVMQWPCPNAYTWTVAAQTEASIVSVICSFWIMVLIVAICVLFFCLVIACIIIMTIPKAMYHRFSKIDWDKKAKW